MLIQSDFPAGVTSVIVFQNGLRNVGLGTHQRVNEEHADCMRGPLIPGFWRQESSLAGGSYGVESKGNVEFGVTALDERCLSNEEYSHA